MKTIDNDIKMNKIKRAYLLYGEERYLIRQYRDKIKNALVSSDDTMNFSAYEGADINQKEIIDLAETLPFFADRRLILIEDSGIFKKGGEDLAEYLPTAPETTCFVFVENEVDKRSKIYKALGQIGAAVEFSKQTDETLARWVGGRIRKEGKGMTQAAYNLFIEKTGTDMENIDKELEKLLCYCMDKENIEVGDVEAITTEQIQNKIFEMVDAISGNQKKKALDMYYDLLALKEAPMKILSLITRQYQQLMVTKAMSASGFNNKEIGKKIGRPDWVARKYVDKSRNLSMDRIKKSLKSGVEYEEAVKTGHMDDQMAVEMFIVSVTES